MILPDTSWLTDADVQAVCRAIAARGARIYFVGGCVRDAILGIPGADIDFATDATPAETTALAEAAGLKAVPTGIDHGTVTVVSGGRGFEVTTFRKDVATDGRRAEVTFSKDIAEDARRRDFTLNALYATPDGAVIDPLGGLEDCRARRIRFIEDPERRIREDYLRILRFFRFHAWYAAPDTGFDADAMDAIARTVPDLDSLSAERVGAEMMRLLGAPDPSPAVAAMRATGVLLRLLPGSDDRFLAPLVHLEAQTGVGPDAVRRLACLGGEDLPERLRLSRKAARLLGQILEAAPSDATTAQIAWRLGPRAALGVHFLRAAWAGQPVSASEIARLRAIPNATFPVSAKDLMPDYDGPALGARLRQLEDRWIASDFKLTAGELLASD